MLADRAHVTAARPAETAEGHVVQLSQNGWVATHGLTHARLFVLSRDGRHLGGQDTLRAETPEDRARLARAVARDPERRIRFAVRFHLHPDVAATIGSGGRTASLALRSGETWIFRHSGPERLTLEPSVYLEKALLGPCASTQIVLTGLLTEFEALVDWTLAKAEETPVALRDLDRDATP